MQERTREGWMKLFCLALFLVVVFISLDARAGRSPEAIAESKSIAKSKSNSTSKSRSKAVSEASAVNEAVNEGNDLTINHEAGAPDVVLVPNNNTESCLRVFGLMFSGKNGGGGLGYPWRSKECDLEAAADDAAAQGNLELSWTFKCKQKSLRKAFGGKDWRKGGEMACLRAVLPAIGMKKEIERLTEVVEFIENERQIEREKCDESKDRILTTCTRK